MKWMDQKCLAPLLAVRPACVSLGQVGHAVPGRDHRVQFAELACAGELGHCPPATSRTATNIEAYYRGTLVHRGHFTDIASSHGLFWIMGYLIGVRRLLDAVEFQIVRGHVQGVSKVSEIATQRAPGAGAGASSS